MGETVSVICATYYTKSIEPRTLQWQTTRRQTVRILTNLAKSLSSVFHLLLGRSPQLQQDKSSHDPATYIMISKEFYGENASRYILTMSSGPIWE